MQKEDYILGLHREEIDRLGFQHFIWQEQSHALWKKAGICSGMKVMDIGAGPGFATLDLSQMVGDEGEIIALERSGVYLDYLKNNISKNNINNIEILKQDLNHLVYPENSLDAAYSRWVFSWLERPEDVISKIAKTIKSGGVFALTEYFNWHSLQMIPENKYFERIRLAAFHSWNQMSSEINIAQKLPEILHDNGFDIELIEPVPALGKTHSLIWRWVTGFLLIYSDKLIQMGLLQQSEADDYARELPKIEQNPVSFIFGPQMVNIIARKK
jgi:ubiquinone/menaquinone biosynthesis C-methylase UbiE